MHGSSSIHFGDVPTWIAAIGTVGTLFWAIALFASDRRTKRRDQLEKQASDVAAWVDESHWSYPHGQAPTGDCTVIVRNGSRLPVTDVLVALLTWDWYTTGSLDRQATRLFPTVAPESKTNPVPFNSEVPPPGKARDERFNPPVLIEFFDAHYRHWRRYPDGRLEQF